MCYIEHHCAEFPLGSSCDIIVFLRRNIVFYLHDVLVKIGIEFFLGWRTKHSVSLSTVATLHFGSLATLQSALHSCHPALHCPCHPASLHSPVSVTLKSAVLHPTASIILCFAVLPSLWSTLRSVLHPHCPVFSCPCSALHPGAPPSYAPPWPLLLLTLWSRHTSSVVGRRRQGFCRTQGRWQGCMVEWQEWWGNWVEEYRVARRAEMREIGRWGEWKYTL